MRVLGRAGKTRRGTAEDALDVARSLPASGHTGKTNDPESATDLSMAYDFVSAYKAGYGKGPCWPELPDKTDSGSSIYRIAPDKKGSDPAQWTAIDTDNGPEDYLSCPPNPTP